MTITACSVTVQAALQIYLFPVLLTSNALLQLITFILAVL